MFQSFYEVARLKNKCRNFTKIPRQRLLCMEDKLFMISITVEHPLDLLNEQKPTDDGGGTMVMMTQMIWTWRRMKWGMLMI
jgi:hypothetical protein